MRKLSVLMLLALLGTAATACERKEGPVEETGESIDDTLGGESDAEKAGEEAGESLDEALPNRD